MIEELLNSDRRRCYYLDRTCPDPSNDKCFCVSLVFENEPGHFPFSGQGECASPWYWDEETCDAQNLKRFGVSREAAWEIVASSMFARV
jgi:hypothetical protein